MPLHRLYTNENFPFPAVERLRELGHDVATIFDDGLGNMSTPDPNVLQRATLHNRALVTLNRRDFIRLHQATPGHAGILVCTVDQDPVALANRIHARIENDQSLVGQLIPINRA